MNAGGWDDENDLQTVSQSWGDALDTLNQSPASMLPVDDNTELAVDLAMLSPVHGSKASPPPAQASKATRASRSQTAATAQQPLLLATQDAVTSAQSPALLDAAPRSETADSTRRAQTRLLQLAGHGGTQGALDAEQGGANPVENAGADTEPKAKRQCVDPPTMPLRQGVLAVAALAPEATAGAGARAVAASGAAGLAWAPEALQHAAAPPRHHTSSQLLAMPGGVSYVGYPGPPPQGGYVPVLPGAGAHLATGAMPWPQHAPSLPPGTQLAASYVSAGVRDTTAMAVAAGAARPDLLGLRPGAAQQPVYPVTAYGTVVGATLPVAAGAAAVGVPAAASALPSIPVRLRNGGPDVPLGTPVAAQLGPAVGAVPHGLLPPPPPAAAAVAAFGYNPALPGAAGAHAPGAAMQLVPPEPGPPPQLAQARFPQQYMLLQAGGAPTPSAVAVGGQGVPHAAIDAAHHQRGIQAAASAGALPQPKYAATVVQVGGVGGVDQHGQHTFPARVAGTIPGATAAQHAVAQVMPRRAIKIDRGTELERNVSELQRQSQELKATQQMYKALEVSKKQACDEVSERIMVHLRDQKANLNMAINEVKSYTNTSGTDVPMVAMMRWSALLGDDFQTARELYQQGEFHQTQFSKALLPPQSVVRGHGL